jgi:hypothetical protein
MAWAKVDDNLTFHPKVLAVGNEAMGVWVRAMSWSMQQLTDGFIPHDIVVAVKGSAVAPALCHKGLWHEVEGGFQFNDWCDYQPTREKVLAEREKNASRMSKWRGKNDDSDGASNGVTNGVTNGVGSPVPTRPDPLTTSKEVVRRATRIPSTFAVTTEMISWYANSGLTVDLMKETDKFIDYWSAVPGEKGKKVDWVSTWRNWLRRAEEFLPTTANVDPWAGKEHLGFAE